MFFGVRATFQEPKKRSYSQMHLKRSCRVNSAITGHIKPPKVSFFIHSKLRHVCVTNARINTSSNEPIDRPTDRSFSGAEVTGTGLPGSGRLSLCCRESFQPTRSRCCCCCGGTPRPEGMTPSWLNGSPLSWVQLRRGRLWPVSPTARRWSSRSRAENGDYTRCLCWNFSLPHPRPPVGACIDQQLQKLYFSPTLQPLFIFSFFFFIRV